MTFLNNHLASRISVVLIGVSALLSGSLAIASQSNCQSCTFTCNSYSVTDAKTDATCGLSAQFLSAGAVVNNITVAAAGWYQCYVATAHPSGNKTCEVSLGDNTVPTAQCHNTPPSCS